MNLVELVQHLKSLEQAENFIEGELPDVEYDLVDIYMVEKLGLDSEIVFFNAEEIPNKLIINIEGITYENLFPLNLTQEMVEELEASNGKISNIEIAKRLLEYREKDA
ncbi:MAG: hypothetical protein J0L86_14985 [Flavobacteriales bacterium]|nr:hypothetical protein [Flavobacteriales bacterium]